MTPPGSAPVFGHILLQCKGFPLSEVKNALIGDTCWDQNFCPDYEGFFLYIVSLIQKIC